MKSTDAIIIVVEDEPGTRATLCGILMEDAGYKVIGLERGTDALEVIRRSPFDAVITDIRLPDVGGLEILELAKEINPDAAVIMMTGYASVETAVDAVNQGAYAYFVKPVNPDEMKTTLANALKQQRLSLENKRLVENLQRTNKLLLEANKELGNEITQRKRMEQELQEKNEWLDAQNEELQSQTEELKAQRQELIEKTQEVERANQLKSEFLANMSHELRTPLNVIIGFSELMADEVPGKINEEQRQCLSDVLNSSQHLLRLINGVLDLSRIESGKVELNMQSIALGEVISSLTRTMMPILTPRKQSLDIEIEEGLPLICADEGKLAQVLLNLVDNSSKFTPDGGKLKIEAVRDGDWCRVSVIDNGIGINKEDQERIFEPFSRLENPLVKERGGTGLGLALVKQIVERYGGLIWVESEYGKGSRFNFTVPLATSGQPNLEEISML